MRARTAHFARPAKARQSSPEDIKVLRRELKKLRRGRELLGIRVKKARCELARTRKRQKDAEKVLVENEAAVAVVSQRLGCAKEGLPQIDEWRVILVEHTLREKVLEHQTKSEKEKHEEHVGHLEDELKKGGRPDTALAREANEVRSRRWAADESCGQIQAVRDYLRGDLDGISLEELQELVRPADVDRVEGKDIVRGVQEYDDLVRHTLAEHCEQQERNARDATKLCNAAIGRKDSLLKALAYNVLGRGLEDMNLCTPTEQRVLRELLKDVESISRSRLQGGMGAP